MSMTPESAKHRVRRTPRKPASALAERWTMIDGVDVFYRESPHPTADSRVMAHIHGFGLSGRYLLPTAERLADEFHTYVPDLPGFGRSGKKRDMLDIPDLARAAADFLEDRGVARASLVGNSMGCPVIIEFAHTLPRAHRAGRPRLACRRPVQSAAATRDGPALARCASRAHAHGASGGARLRAVRRAQHDGPVQGAHAISVTRTAAGDEDPHPRGARRARPAAARLASRERDRQPDRQPRARGPARGRRPRHQLQPSRPAGPHHPAVHGRPADRERPVVAGRCARVRGAPRQASSAADGRC